MTTSADLVSAITDMREDDAIAYARELVDGGTDPVVILEACREAMDIIGKRFEIGEAFIPELILAGEMLKTVSEVVKPHLKSEEATEAIGKVVIGTVEGDIHDIAKDIVAFMLEINGFEVTDLGVDVPVAGFVKAVEETGARIVGLSGFLTLAYDPMKATVAALKAAGFDGKVMVGGGQVDESIRDYTGADAYGKDAMAAVTLAKEWSGAA
jgi:5-methyltetrahydrofolate--homocysteine methyltransferase